MNLEKMFASQKALREHINYNGHDRFEKSVLALLVELGECANEWRGFKFWSKNQEPKGIIEHLCPTCNGTGDAGFYGNESLIAEGEKPDSFDPCTDCEATGRLGTTNSLLEEFVDGLALLLDICVDKHVKGPFQANFEEDITNQFRTLFYHASTLNQYNSFDTCEYLIEYYLGLGEMLGFSSDQIEQAYYAKNKINHERQENGY